MGLRRATGHRLFALVTAALLVVCAWHGWQWFEHRRTAAAIAAVPASLDAPPADMPVHPAVRLAVAGALSRGGNADAAERLYVQLVDSHGDGPLGQAARYNLANHYLRHAQSAELDAGRARPLLGMAKQRYRDVLRIEPMHWDARINLERALALAPEGADHDDTRKQVHQRANVVVPDFEQLNLP